MATYYKYAERDADSQVNWAEVGKGISDMLKEEVNIREQKKAAYDKAYREDTEQLANAPQGKWQDGNRTVNNFAHDMMAQQLIDYKLLKSGQMNERDYTLRRENYKSQSNTLFDLQKLLQAERQSTIDLYQSQEIQGMNISNMADVEAYTDFANASAVIDPYAANINMSIFEDKVVDGKTVRVVKKSTPVNVLKGQIVQKIPTFKVEQAITKDVDSLGDDIDFIYQAATTSKAGTITELIGYGAFQGEYKKKDSKGNPLYPQFADSVKKVDDAIEQTINKYFANPYNISSVLTENTGKYSAESYVWDKDEASKDKSKLLKKIDPLTGLTTLDTDAPHYDEQVAEAREWVKKRMLSQLDSKRQLKTTSQLQLQEPREQSEAKLDRIERGKAQIEAAGAWNKLYTGTTAAEKKAAADILLGTPGAKEMGLLKIDLESNPGTVILKYANSKLNREIPMKGVSLDNFSASGVEVHGVADTKKALAAGGGGRGYGGDIDFTGVSAGRAGAEPAPISIPVDIFKAKSDKSAEAIQKMLPEGFIAEDTGTWALGTNTVRITAPDGREITYKSDVSPKDIIAQKAAIENFIKPKAGTTGGVGAKY